jgi:hypothetical protein
MTVGGGDETWSSTNVHAAAVNAIALAQAAEQTVTPEVRNIVEAHGGEMALPDSRIKKEASLTEKILLIRRQRDANAETVLQRIPDVLRYTAVLPDEEYWPAGTLICQALISAGYYHVVPCTGWETEGYRGRNERLETPRRYRFELQIHTPASLRATVLTHMWYKAIRRPDTPWALRSYYRQLRDHFYAQVPIPPGTPHPLT